MERNEFELSRLFSGLMKIGHGDLGLFVDDGLKAAVAEPELFAHYVAWNAEHGEVHDSKVAFPVIALRGLVQPDKELAENAVAHIVNLNPRKLLEAYRFNSQMVQQGHPIPNGYRRMLEWAINQYLQVREEKPKWWAKAVVSNRKAMTALYTVAHRKPVGFVQKILFEKQYVKGTVFWAIEHLKEMGPGEAAGTILEYNIPMPIAVGAVAKAKDPAIVLALLEQASGNELINYTNALKEMGAFKDPALRAAYEAALVRAKSDKRTHTLKASRAAEAVGDKELAQKLTQVQRARTEQLGGIEGDWLVLGDKSGSMHQSIVVARRVAALLAQQVKGKVYLIFFDTSPTLFDVTGKELDQIEQETRRVMAGGMTSIGCGLSYATQRKLAVNGIAIVSDGGENTHPIFSQAYENYVKQMSLEPTVYLFHVPGDANYLDHNCRIGGVQLETYELGDKVDYYSLPNIVKALKVTRWGLLDEIRETPLLTFDQVFQVQEA